MTSTRPAPAPLDRPGAGARGAAGGGGPRAVAVDGDRRPRQPGAPQPGRAEGRRPPGVVGLDRLDHDGAVVPRAAPRGPGVGQAARLAGAARDQPPARRARRVVPRDAARGRRPAVLPVALEGPRPRRLLDRLGRHRRDRPDLGHDRAPLRRGARAARRHGAAVLAGRRRGARRGRGLGGRARPDGARARRGLLDRRLQPAEPRPRRPRHLRHPAARAVHRRGVAGHQRQVRAAALRALRQAGWRRPAPAHRRDDQPGVPAAAALHPAAAARTPPRRRARGRGDRRAAQGGHRRRGARRDPQPRRPRPRRARRRLRRHRRHPPDGDLRVHGEGLRARDAGAPAEPLVAAHRDPDAGAGDGAGHRPRRPVGAPARRAGRRPLRRDRHPSAPVPRGPGGARR